MKTERDYIVEYRKAGRGQRTSKVRTARITAANGKAAKAAVQQHPAMKGMKILNLSWKKPAKQTARRSKTRKPGKVRK